MPSGKKIFEALFACRHRHLSRLVTIQHQTYQVCLDCGARIRYSWQTMSSIDEREPLLRSLMVQLIHFAKQKILHAMSR